MDTEGRPLRVLSHPLFLCYPDRPLFLSSISWAHLHCNQQGWFPFSSHRRASEEVRESDRQGSVLR